MYFVDVPYNTIRVVCKKIKSTTSLRFTFFNKIYDTKLPSMQQLRWLRTRKPLAYRESTRMNLSAFCHYERIVYYLLKHPYY